MNLGDDAFVSPSGVGLAGHVGDSPSEFLSTAHHRGLPAGKAELRAYAVPARTLAVADFLFPDDLHQLAFHGAAKGGSTAGEHIGARRGEKSLGLGSGARSVSIITGGAADGHTHQGGRREQPVGRKDELSSQKRLRRAPAAGDHRGLVVAIMNGGFQRFKLPASIIVGEIDHKMRSAGPGAYQFHIYRGFKSPLDVVWGVPAAMLVRMRKAPGLA